MSSTVQVSIPAALGVAVGPESPAFAVPAKHNPRLQALVERLNADEELWQLWRCANANALDRLGLNDHGEVHVRIVANAALRLLRLLRDAGRVPGAVAQYHLPPEEAEVVVVLAAALHDVGLAVYPGEPWAALAAVAGPKARELLAPLYPPRERTVLVSEVQQTVAGHHRGTCLTLEAGVLHLADALDIAEGRLQQAANGEAQNTALAHVEAVAIKKGTRCPVRVDIRMSQRSGADDLSRQLARTLQAAVLTDLVEVAGRCNGQSVFALGM